MKTIRLLSLMLMAHLVGAQTFTLKSDEMGGQATSLQVFNGFGCAGNNVSPQLYWENPPAATKSFAITIYDEDAPTGSGWWHWLIFDIDKHASEIKSNAGSLQSGLAPAGSIQSKTDFGVSGYGGPCPPEGDKAHRYVVTIYALKTDKLGLDADANPALVGFMLEQNTIEKASLIFYYRR
ncbi:MAG: YbhB/YbcL family Raf kinase inhibitor-like protein [Bacteroidota bacterium]